MLSSATLEKTLETDIDHRSVALAKLSEAAGDLAINLGIALLVVIATFWIAGLAQRAVARAMSRLPHTRDDKTLQSFAASLVRYGIIGVGLVATLHRLGVETSSLIAVLGAVSLAIGLAIQGALSNVAAGVMILLFRPYRVGDWVTIAGKTGCVKKLDLFNTELVDVDGLKIVAPNAKGFGDVVVNYTDIPSRRIELNFSVRYEDGVEAAILALQGLIAADDRLLADPAPWVNATDLGPSSVTVTLRVWCEVDAYVIVRSDLIRSSLKALATAGVAHAYPVQLTEATGVSNQSDAP